MVALHENAHLSYDEIGKAVHLSKSSVASFIQRYKATGKIYPDKSPGRPRKLSPSGERDLIVQIRARPRDKLARFGHLVGVSEATARRVAARHGLHSRVCARKPFISVKNRGERLEWAVRNRWTDWREVCFTDESCFRIGDTGVQRVMRKVGEEFLPQHMAVKFRHGLNLHIWGGIIHGHKFPLVRFDLRKARQVNKERIKAETITGEVYGQQILQGPLQDMIAIMREKGVDIKVMEDGASVHFKGKAAAIRADMDIPHQAHPPSSPDLNPIETVWRILKAKARRLHPHPTNLDDLWVALQRIYDEEITVERINGLIGSMERRRRAVVKNKGHGTRF